MVKGKNMPEPLRAPDSQRSYAVRAAEKQLGRKIMREEAAVLSSGMIVFVDSEDRDPVTGLYSVRDVPGVRDVPRLERS